MRSNTDDPLLPSRGGSPDSSVALRSAHNDKDVAQPGASATVVDIPPATGHVNAPATSNVNAPATAHAAASPLIAPAPPAFAFPFDARRPPTSAEFLAVTTEIRAAIEAGVWRERGIREYSHSNCCIKLLLRQIYPVRIAQGSSGSYFCKDRTGRVCAGLLFLTGRRLT